VKKFKGKFGADKVVSNAIAMAHHSVYLSAQAVKEAGTDDVAAVLKLIVRQSLSAPEGIVAIDPQTRHACRPASIGRIRVRQRSWVNPAREDRP
jgi:urea transport system substrate-binding protein